MSLLASLKTKTSFDKEKIDLRAKKFVIDHLPRKNTTEESLSEISGCIQLSKEEILKYFEGSVVFKNENNEYLERAISAYLGKDYLVSSHFFITLIEKGIKELVRIRDCPTMEPNAQSGYDIVSLSLLLDKNAPILESIFENILPTNGSGISSYFRFVLTRKKSGMNLRNDWAHGHNRETFFKRDISDRLFHILICLSLVRQKHIEEKRL